MPPEIDRERGRYFLKDAVRLQVDFSRSAQSRGLPPPPVEQPFDPAAPRIALARPGAWQGIEPLPLEQAIARRESRRGFQREPLTADELAFLLWATQGVRKAGPQFTLRTVPSAGARHAFETHLVVLNVAGLAPGLYRYLPLEHELLFRASLAGAAQRVAAAAHGQEFAGTASVVFVWTAVPARMEWRYAGASYKVMALDAGHVCQNLYLACECIGAGACAIAAYRQDLMDELLGVDGEEEFTVYLAPVGKVRP